MQKYYDGNRSCKKPGLFFCPVCETAFGIYRQQGKNNKIDEIYLPGWFPKISCVKKKCKICRGVK